MATIDVTVADKPTLDNVNTKVDNILDLLLDTQGVYGFIEHTAVLSPTERIEYIGINKDYTPLQVVMGGGYNYNSWLNFPTLLANKPWMVKSDGTPDYELDENDYTKKLDGTDSDVSNTEYDGGAYSWFPKIYKWERSFGDDRVVKFSFEPKDGYEPLGFIDPDGNELEGVWLPMFYGSVVNGKMVSFSGTQPSITLTTDAQNTAIKKLSNRAHFLGGALLETIIDLCIMWAKNTNSQSAYGSGNSSGYVNTSPYYGVLPNAVVNGGQFYGTSDGKHLNKILHSVVFGTYNQYMRDPYELVVNGKVKVSENYNYDLTGATYKDTGIFIDQANQGWKYPSRLKNIIGYGGFPVYPYKASTSTGICDVLYISPSQSNFIAVVRRFGCCADGSGAGLRCRDCSGSTGGASWYIGASGVLLPPVGVAA